MFKFFNPGSVRGIGMVVLQILRVFTIITLAAVCASCWVFIIKVDKERAYFVFECASLCFTSIISVVLIISEVPPLKAIKNYFAQTWPVLSERHGLGWLGGAMVMLGCNILGNLNKPANDTDKLGPHFSKLVLASAVLAITFGVLNIIGAMVWRDGKEGLTSRDIRANGSLANRRESLPDYVSSTAHSHHSEHNEKRRSKFLSMFMKKNGGEKTSDRPNISPPMSAHHDVEHGGGGAQGDRGSPIVPGLRRPDTALHPMHTGHSSRYSEANMSRF